TPRLFTQRFAHEDGRAHIVPVSPARDTVAGPGMTLITGRLLEHYQSGAQTRRVPELMGARPELIVQLHPATAAGLAVGEGDAVLISNDRGAVRARAEITADIRHDTVFLPFHFPDDQRANVLTEAVVDPISGMPEVKRSVVTVTKAGAAA